MPRLISITDAKKRDAEVEAASPPRSRDAPRYVGPAGEPVELRRLIKGTDKTSFEALLARFESPEAISGALIEGDPELDLEQVGRPLRRTSRVYMSPDGKVLYVARVLRVTYSPTGEELEREDFVDVEATVGEEQPPLPWTGRLIPKADAVRRFAFVRQLQLRHVNGLTFDFLYEIAKTLQDEGKLMLVGTGPKGREPLIFQMNGSPLRGFLEGRVEEDAYRLVLHLSNLEIKRVTEDPPAEAGS